MTTWTEQGVTAGTWSRPRVNAGTTWDGGDTLWDVNGNVVDTYWDVTDMATAWSEASGGSTSWTEV